MKLDFSTTFIYKDRIYIVPKLNIYGNTGLYAVDINNGGMLELKNIKRKDIKLVDTIILTK